MKYLKILMLFVAAIAFTACDDDEPSGKSIFDTTPPERNEFDTWILNTFTKPYNITLLYRYQDSETNNSYNVVPPTVEKAKAMANLMKYMWLDAYNELMDDDGLFMKQYAFREFLFIGSHQYNSNGSRVLGTAEGGLKVTLFGLNHLDLDNLRIVQDQPFPDHDDDPMDLNYYFFHTMHHEFCHILTQKKDYTTEFRTISPEWQRMGDWINVRDYQAPKWGFVTGYATSEYNEDFAEIYSTYVTITPQAFQEIFNVAKKDIDDKVEGANPNAILQLQQKVDIVKTYMKTSWGIDMDKLRDIVLRRGSEIMQWDRERLLTLN